MRKRIVIWGLRERRHSHRYIHKGFYENFKSLGYETFWVEDELHNQEAIFHPCVVFAADIASTHLLFKPNNQYVLHNFNAPDFIDKKNVLNLQVSTINSTGSSIDSSISLFDETKRTLFQPWGIPEPQDSWMETVKVSRRVEHWVGSIWNNKLGQGNREVMRKYKDALRNFNFLLRIHGGTRGLTREGLSSKKAMKLVNKSPIGSSIVGLWQKEHNYVPCRIFKNVASGQIPSSNGDFEKIFGSTGIFSANLEQLISDVLTIGHREKSSRVLEAQYLLLPYTYKAGIERILKTLNGW